MRYNINNLKQTNMLTKLIFFIGFLHLSFSSLSQDNSPHHIGMSAGVTTGFGLSYRYWPSKLGVQLTALPTMSQNNGSLTSVGLTVLYILKDREKIDLYAYLGNSILYFKENNTSDLVYNSGLGFGLKFDIFDELNINTQFGYGGINLANKNRMNFSIIGELGLYYHF